MPEETALLPNTATEAADVWFRGGTLRAFRVAADKASQEEIYAAAFHMIRSGDVAPSSLELGSHETLSRLDHESAHSIAFVAMRSGWAVMVQGHIHPNSPEILIKKPA